MRRGLLVVLLWGCTRVTETFVHDEPPQKLVYPTNPANYSTGAAITANVPTHAGGDISLYSVSPALPAGLTLDANTGILTGTPASASAATTYAITASNSFGSTGAQLLLSVSDVPPTALSYALNPAVYAKSVTIDANAPALATGVASLFDVSPALPAGLGLNAKTGIITGTPASVTAAGDYTITASNGSGATSVVFQVTVNDIPPAITFHQTPFTFVKNRFSSTSPPDNAGGAIVNCAIARGAPDLPTGLSVSSHTCEISGIPVTAQPVATYMLALDYVGGSTIASIDLGVNDSLTIFPPTLSLTASSGQGATFAGRGGAPPYAFELIDGPGRIDVLTGTFTAAVRAAASTVRVTDSIGSTATAIVQNVRAQTNGVVSAMVSDNESIYMGGSFTATHPHVAQNFIAIDTTTGERQLSFDVGSGFDGQVMAIAVNSTSVFVGGFFRTYRGVNVGALVKLDRESGALDLDFARAGRIGNAQPDEVEALAADDDFVYAAGRFSAYGSQAVGNLAKVDARTGLLDSTFSAPLGFNQDIGALALGGGALYATGSFTSYRQTPSAAFLPGGGLVSRIAKLDVSTGNLDAAYAGTFATTNGIEALAYDAGALYIGGDFTQYRGTAVGGIARLVAATGAIDSTFPAIGTGFNPRVISIAVTTDALYVGGIFSTYGGQAAGRLVKLAKDTAVLDKNFNIANGINTALVTGVATTPEGVFFTGEISTVGGQAAQGVGKVLAADDSLDPEFNQPNGLTGQNNFADGLAIAASGHTVFVGGFFSYYRGAAAGHVAKFDLQTSSRDATFDPQLGFDGPVASLALDGSALYCGGTFAHYQTNPAQNLAKLDTTRATLDQTFTGATGVAPATALVSALQAVPGSLFVGGNFTSYRGAAVSRGLLKLTQATGAPDGSFVSAGIDTGAVFALAVDTISVYFGGSFGKYGATASKGMGKVNLTTGAIDTTFTTGLGAGFNAAVRALLLSNDCGTPACILVGGDFSTFVPNPNVDNFVLPSLVKIHTTNASLEDSDFHQDNNPIVGSVLAMAISGTSLYLGGTLSQYPSFPAPISVSNIVKVDLDSDGIDTTFAAGSASAFGLGQSVTSVVQTGGTVAVGGNFNVYEGVGTYNWCALEDFDASRGD